MLKFNPSLWRVTLFLGYLLLFINGQVHLVHLHDGLPLCPLHAITGFLCPGCGMTRAFFALSEFHFENAFHLNPLSLPLFFGGLVYTLIPNKMNATLKLIPENGWRFLTGLVVFFGVYRNF